MRFWNPERLARLRQCIEVESMSVGMAAREIGCTRNAAMGAVNRNRIVCPERKPRRGKEGRITSRINRFRFQGGPSLPPSPLPQVEPVSELPFLGVTLMDLAPDQCRYPHGEDTFTFCGQPKHGESSYCAFHYDLTHTTPQKYDRGFVKFMCAAE